MEPYADAIGNIGVICFLTAYFLLQKNRVNPQSLGYLSLNLAGALLVIFSLLYRWNLSAFLLEAAWALITLYGMYKHVYLRRKDKETAHDGR